MIAAKSHVPMILKARSDPILFRANTRRNRPYSLHAKGKLTSSSRSVAAQTINGTLLPAVSTDLAPNFYPVLSSLRRLIVPCLAGCAKAMGA
jgi:hypothetical protein